MSKKINIDAESIWFWPAIAALFIAFWGEPDLVDAVIHWLMKG